MPTATTAKPKAVKTAPVRARAKAQNLSELQQFGVETLDPKFRADPKVRAAFKQQTGYELPQDSPADVVADLAADAAERGEDAQPGGLDDLESAQEALESSHQTRLQQDRLRRKQPDSRAAMQQAALDEAQQRLRQIQQLEERTSGRIAGRVNAFADRIGAWRTPGGIAILLMVLFALIFILIPVDGQPRFVWMWLVLTRRAKLRPETEALHTTSTPVHVENTAPSATDATAAVSTNNVIDYSAATSLYGDYSRYFKGV